MIGKFSRTIFLTSFFVFVVMALAQRDLRQASAAAITAGVGVTGAMAIASREERQAQVTEHNHLRKTIEVLRQEQAHLETYVNEAFQLEQELSASVRSLKSERLRLLSRISDLNYERNEVSIDLKQLHQENQLQQQLQESTEAALFDLQQQHQQLQEKLEAHAALDALAPEVRLHRLHSRLGQVRRKLAKQQHQQKLVQTELSIAQEQKIDLEGELYDLRAEFNVLDQRYQEMKEDLIISEEQYRDISFSLLGGKAAVKRLSHDILEKRQEKEALIAEIDGLQQMSPLAADEQIVELLPSAWQAWFRFVEHLAPEERAFLKIILSQENLVSLPEEFPSMTHAPIETLAAVLQERATSFLGESPFVRVEDRPLLQLKEEYHSLLSRSLLLPISEDRYESKT